MRQRLGADLNEARLRMANVPEGATLLCADALFAPIILMRNVYIFPGIPKILQERFHGIKEQFRDAPYYLKNVYVRHGEGIIATMLNDLLVKYPELMLGSYPVLDLPDYKVKVTLESKDAELFDSGAGSLRRLPAERRRPPHRLTGANGRIFILGQCCRHSSRRRCRRMPGMLRALGPGVVFMALAQGSGELIFWPYTIAKYGLSFLVFAASRLFAAIPGHLRDRPLHLAHRRKHLSRLHPLESILCFFSLDLDDAVVSLVRRLRRRRRHFDRRPQRFPHRLVPARADAYFGPTPPWRFFSSPSCSAK